MVWAAWRIGREHVEKRLNEHEHVGFGRFMTDSMNMKRHGTFEEFEEFQLQRMIVLVKQASKSTVLQRHDSYYTAAFRMQGGIQGRERYRRSWLSAVLTPTPPTRDSQDGCRWNSE